MEFTQIESVLYETLVMASSQDVSIVKSAEEKLQEWEKQPGYYSTLLKIISNHCIESTVRWLAASIFKNGIDKYWRKAAENAIQEEEKISLRSSILNTFTEPVQAVALQLSSLVSRIARYDCPREWPELIPTLIQLIKSDDSVMQHRGLFILNQVIKALESKRLPGDKRLFLMITADIYSFVLNLWNTLFQKFFLQFHSNDLVCHDTLAKVLLTGKILRKLTIHGFKKPHESQCAMSFVSSLFEKIKEMFVIYKFMEKSMDLTILTEKVISHMTAVLLALLENHPYSFVSFIPPSLNLIFSFVFSEPPHLLFEKFVVQCLNLMKAILLCQEYKKTKFSETSCSGTNNLSQIEVTQEVNRFKNEFFTPDVVEKICVNLISNYFLLTKEDLLLWESDPENFALDDVGESWKFCLHPCTHSFYLTLLHEYRDILIPVVLRLVRDNQQIVDPQDLHGLLKKDAIYSSVGLCAFDFYDEIDFDQWFTNTLVHELQIKEPNYRIIRRKVTWLIGKWTDVKPATQLRSALCDAVIPLLRSDEDVVVRISAATAFKSIVDSLEFTTEEYAKFLEPSFSMLFTLLREVRECSTKIQVLSVLSYVVERVGEAIKPHVQALIQYLPVLWQESVEYNMLRCVIVSTLVQFVKALLSENLTKFLYPVIECCIDCTDKAHIYLMEDGLELWLTVVEYSSSLTPELSRIYENMPVILENTLEHLECCCNIIQAYILLNPEKFLTEFGESLIAMCSSLLTDVNEKGIVKIMQVVETAIKANPEIGVNISLPMLVYTTLSICEEESWTMVMSMYFAVICRTLLFSTEIFSQVLEKAANVKSWMVEALLEQILIVWNKMMPLVTQLEKRKLLALALASLLTVQSTVVMSQFSSIIKNIVEALNDIMDIDNLSAELNSLMLAEDKSFFSEDAVIEGSKTEMRRQLLNEYDPVYKIELKGYLQSQFNNLRNQVGENNFENLLKTLDPEVFNQCRMYVSF